MREGLREVAKEPLADRVVLLRDQAEVVGEGYETPEQGTRLLGASDPRQRVGEPEGARQERALHTREAIDGPRVAPGGIAVDEAVPGDSALHRFDGTDHALVVRREEADGGDEQHARIELL